MSRNENARRGVTLGLRTGIRLLVLMLPEMMLPVMLPEIMPQRLKPLLWAQPATGPSSVSSAASLELEVRYVAGLRERQLFELAEAYCEHRYQLLPVGKAGARGAMAVEWIRTLTAHALSRPAAERAAFAQRAHDVARRYVAEHREHSQSLLVRAQDALADFALGELARQEAEVRGQVPVDPSSAVGKGDVESPTSDAGGESSVLKVSRQAVRALEQLDQELTQLLPQRFRRPATAADEWTAEELAGLQHQLRLQAARALRNVALCYGAASDDRLATLNRALQLLEKSQKQIATDDPLAAQLQLEHAAALRLLGKSELAIQALDQLPGTSQPAKLAGDLAAERVRCWLSQGQREPVERYWASLPRDLERQSPELALARLEYLIAQWRQAVETKRAAEATNWQRAAGEQLRTIEREQDAYWRHRGELLLIAAGAQGGPVSAEIISRTADRLYREGRWEEAVREYDRAAESSKDQSVFSLRYRAALVLQEQKQYRQAAERLSRLGLEYPQQVEAPEAHLQAAWNWAQQLRSATDEEREAVSSFYIDSLHRQIKTWPDHESASQARAWLGVYFEQRDDFKQAIAAYSDIASQSPLYETALRGIARMQQRRWSDARRLNQTIDAAEVKAAADFFLQAARDAADESRETPIEVRSFAATTAALYQLQLPAIDYPLVEQLVRPLLAETMLKANESQATAQSLLIVALAGQPSRVEEARTQLRTTLEEARRAEASGQGELPGEAVFMLLGQLERVARSAPSAQRVALARLRLELLEPAAIESLTTDARMLASLRRMRAEALATAGERAESIVTLQQLLAASPADGDTREQLAELWLASGAAADWQRALGEYRKLAAGSKPRTPRWYRAKLGVAAAQIKAGDKAGARQLIEFLRVTPPGLRDTPYEQAFEKLWRESGP